MKPKLYTLYARYCGHVQAVHPDRHTVETAAQLAAERRVRSLRVCVAEPADYQLALDGERCDRCEPAGVPVPDPSSPPACERCDRPDVLGWHTIGCKTAEAAYAAWSRPSELEAANS